MLNLTQAQKLHYTLRVASAMCFIGHGAFGIITKPIWCNYFAVFGITHDMAYRLMPLLGSFDILLGILILVYPIRIIPAWLVVWAILTAFLRPLSGEPFAEFLERAGNYGAPLVFLLLSGNLQKNAAAILVPAPSDTALDEKALRTVTIGLRVIVFLLLAGHGWLNMIEKKGLLSQYEGLGFSHPAAIARLVGIAETGAALTLLLRPSRSMVIVLLLWKMGSELFYPHYELFEWIERGGSYGVLLALWFALETPPARAYDKLNGLLSSL